MQQACLMLRQVLASTLKFCVQVILHTGDMRWHPRMGKHPALAKQRVDQLFLDTTYASPKHTFPSQVGIQQTWQRWLITGTSGACISPAAASCDTRSK